MSFKLLPLQNTIADVEGFSCNGVKAGLKQDDYDVGFIYSDAVCDVSAIFTTNRFQAAPLKHFKLKKIQKSNFCLVNSKNANAMTGQAGIEDIEYILNTLHFDVTGPFMSSTGVIGVRLPKEKIVAAAKSFDFSKKSDINFARAIMTTDTFIKKIGFKVILEDGRSFNIAGIAKGAGMIDPAMATMLCFIATDADIPKADSDELLLKHAQTTFNAISVDGDRSTNDSVFLFSNKKSGAYDKEAFSFALYRIMHELALMIVKDGEGATKLVGFEVSGAKSDSEAKVAAKALTNSLLVKTALFGEDPNWGRIAATIGASGVECYEERLTVAFEDVVVYNKGEILFDKEREERAHQVMKKSQFTIRCDLGVADGYFKAYGCDLGYEYIKINAEYRT